uniref:Uncharacterized protein n=1 Tax=Panagrolaimus sp. ES5 TaxID=591445 RepID=A0AC34GW43_9BILA
MYRNQAFFVRPDVAKDLDCASFFEPRNISHSKKQNMKLGVYQIERVTWKTPNDLPMTCENILSRHHFPSKPLSISEKDFPIAFARIVYTVSLPA